MGKTTVAAELMKLEPRFRFIRSATTRQPRGDGNDAEYIYLGKDSFMNLVNNGDMLEYTEFGGNFYGTPDSEIERILGEGNIPLLILDINGVVSLKSIERSFGVCTVYIYDELNVMEQRLYDRELAVSPSADALSRFVKRKTANMNDYFRLPTVVDNFDSMIKNENPETTAKLALSAFIQTIQNQPKDMAKMEKIAKNLKSRAEEKIG